MMRKRILILCITIFLLSCNNDDSNSLKSEGVITGLDFRLCACCGGYFIEIEDETYVIAEFPEHNLDLTPENLPLKVRLNWEKTDCGELIKINWIEATEN